MDPVGDGLLCRKDLRHGVQSRAECAEARLSEGGINRTCGVRPRADHSEAHVPVESKNALCFRSGLRDSGLIAVLPLFKIRGG